MLRTYFDGEVNNCMLNVKTVDYISWIISTVQVFFRESNYVQSSQRTKLCRNTDCVPTSPQTHYSLLTPFFPTYSHIGSKSPAIQKPQNSPRLLIGWNPVTFGAGGHVISRSTSVGAGGGGRLWLWVSVRGNTVGRILIKQLAHVSLAFSPSHPVKKAMTHRPSIRMSLSEPVPASPATPACIRSSGRERFVNPRRNLEV